MKTNLKKLITICLAVLFTVTVALPVQIEAATTPKLNKTSLTLCKGKSYRLKVTNTKAKVKWSSSKKTVAAVSSKGNVAAKGTGTAYITAQVGTKKVKCKVVVKNHSWKNVEAQGHYETQTIYEHKQQVDCREGYNYHTPDYKPCDFSCWDNDAWQAHMEETGHMAFNTYWTDVPVGEKEVWIETQPAYKKCSRCKAKK